MHLLTWTPGVCSVCAQKVGSLFGVNTEFGASYMFEKLKHYLQKKGIIDLLVLYKYMYCNTALMASITEGMNE